MNYKKGSEWRKWDLHIHTPLSELNNQFPKLADGSPDWESYIEALESLDFAVIGITDYFSLEGYKKILEYKASGRLDNFESIFPNIEFRLSNILSSRRDGARSRRLNFHVIFSDELSPEEIEEHFLHDIYFYFEGNPQDRDEQRKLKLANLEELGERLIGEHEPFRDGRSALEIGMMNAVVNHEEISKILTEHDRFKNKYILVFPEELSNLIGWDGQDHHVRKGILQKSDMVFSSNPNTIRWCLGQEPYQDGEKGYIKEFKTLKPCIHGSDAHGIDELGIPCSKRGEAGHVCGRGNDCDLRYCWIKSDPTFEGFRQLLYEPEERVSIQELDPTPPRGDYTFQELKISSAEINDELSLSNLTLGFNRGLVAVTGGKGAGKTAFVDLIANCFQDRVDCDDNNSFVKRISDQGSVQASLKFRGGTVFSKNSSDDEYFEESELVYIAQGELENYIGETSDLSKYINNLVFNSRKVKNSALEYEYQELFDLTEQRKLDLRKLNQKIFDLENLTKPEILKEQTVKIKQLESLHKDLSNRIAEAEKLLGKPEIEKAKKKQEELRKLKKKKELLSELEKSSWDLLLSIDEDIERFNQIVERVNKLLEQIEDKDRFQKLEYREKGKLEKKHKAIQRAIGATIKAIEVVQTEVDKFAQGVKAHSRLLEKKGDAKEAFNKAKEQRQALKDKQRGLIGTEKKRNILLKDLINGVIQTRDKYKEIIEAFSEQKTQVLSDIDFQAQLKFKAKKLIGGAMDILDNRKVILDEEAGDLGELMKLYGLVVAGGNDKVDDLVSETARLSKELANSVRQTSTVTKRDFYDLLYDDYFSLMPVVNYKGVALAKLSLGQKTTILIKIYLAEGTSPIIIDSHDDHLDNEYIMDELILSIREAKKFRQIILVSNNGNVVINSDSEQIIIAGRNDSGKISYKSGSIENPRIRKRVLKVLEGGKEAFMKRQQKYRM